MSAAAPAYPVWPDGCMDLLYSPGVSLDLVGPMTTVQRFDLEAGERREGLRFRPGIAGRFFRIDAAELRDRAIPLEALIGPRARRLLARLDAAESIEERSSLLNGPLLGCAPRPGPIQLAIAAMTRAHGAVDLDWVAGQARMSARQFRRRCLQESGLGPKHLARVLRFRRAWDLAARGESWLRVAVEAGYFDQAHLVRDFREFAGAAPVAVFSKTAGRRIG